MAKQPTAISTDAPSRKVNIVPMVFFTSSRRLPPTARAMMTWPAEEKPMATNVNRCSMSPPMDTADMPALPM